MSIAISVREHRQIRVEQQNVWVPNRANQPRGFNKFSTLSLYTSPKPLLENLFLLAYKPTSPASPPLKVKNKLSPAFSLFSSSPKFTPQIPKDKISSSLQAETPINEQRQHPFWISFTSLRCARSLS